MKKLLPRLKSFKRIATFFNQKCKKFPLKAKTSAGYRLISRVAPASLSRWKLFLTKVANLSFFNSNLKLPTQRQLVYLCWPTTVSPNSIQWRTIFMNKSICVLSFQIMSLDIFKNKIKLLKRHKYERNFIFISVSLSPPLLPYSWKFTANPNTNGFDIRRKTWKIPTFVAFLKKSSDNNNKINENSKNCTCWFFNSLKRNLFIEKGTRNIVELELETKKCRKLASFFSAHSPAPSPAPSLPRHKN